MRIINTADLTPHRISKMGWLEKECVYNGLDNCVTLEVLQALRPQLDNVSAATYEFSRALQAPILEMSTRGVRVDQERRQQVLAQTRRDIDRLAAQLTRLVKDGIGVEVGWRSPQQLGVLLYDVMQLPEVKKRNANGQFVRTTNREAIEKLSHYFIAEPICNHLLALRDLDKRRSFLETGIDRDGRMRCNFNIAGTNTGRLASAMSDLGTGTNMQNIDRDLRSIFIADEGMKFANLDLEQGDARNVGAICWNTFTQEDEAFAGSYLAACESGDLHTSVCRMAWRGLDWNDDPDHNKRVAEVLAYRQDSYRQLAKKLGHGTNYFGTPRTMAKHTKVETSLIEEFQQRYFGAFPVIGCYNKHDKSTPCWHNRVRQALRTEQALTTLLGRRRYFFGRPSDDETLRAAIAYEPQSLTAEEINIGLLRVWRAHRVQLLLQVHDSILLQFPEDQEDEVIPWALDIMRVNIELAKGRNFHVPVEAKVGWNWGEVQYWTKDDHDKGKCTRDQIGTVKANPEGLVKWSPHKTDSRRRSAPPSSNNHRRGASPIGLRAFLNTPTT